MSVRKYLKHPMWTNYHTHTTYCDGKSSVTEVVALAHAANMLAIGLSSHAPLPFEKKWCMKPGQLDNYLQEIKEVRSRHASIEVYAGLEADYIPGKIAPMTFRQNLDYVIGSIHFVDEFSDGQGWEIDGPYEDFRRGFESIFKNNMKAVVKRYYELTRKMIRESCPDIIGHIDKIKMQNREASLFNEDDEWYRAEINETLASVRRAGCIVEVNTRGVYQRKTTTTYPSPWIIEEMAKTGIPVTLSSDAHHPSDLVNMFPDAAGILLQAGIKKIRILSGGTWRDVGFDEHGIKDYKVAH